jgi:hypothetical protein
LLPVLLLLLSSTAAKARASVSQKYQINVQKLLCRHQKFEFTPASE